MKSRKLSYEPGKIGKSTHNLQGRGGRPFTQGRNVLSRSQYTSGQLVKYMVSRNPNIDVQHQSRMNALQNTMKLNFAS